jgi:hypothetical protein
MVRLMQWLAEAREWYGCVIDLVMMTCGSGMVE